MKPISFPEFDRIYQPGVSFVLEHWTREMQTELALHCHGWRPEAFDFTDYLRASSLRFYRAYLRCAEAGDKVRVCDVGGFWGVFPLVLQSLGFQVAMTEALQYYGESFKPLFHVLTEKGVRIIDFDPFEAGAAMDESFDVVTIMAVLEHYPHSLKEFMTNVDKIIRPKGHLYLEVPNLAYWPRRIELLRGRSPLVNVADIYESRVPFIGHHHEFTRSELTELARLGGWRVVASDTYNYTPGVLPKMKYVLRAPVQFAAFALWPDTREVLAVWCERTNEHSTLATG
ncbi:MAG: methyltransferase domain-containing protein [Pyrinomonadaceae bacterium]